MNVESISAVSSAIDTEFLLPTETLPFSQRLQAEFIAANEKLTTAETGLMDLAAGKQGNIHHVMLALEDARMSFQLLAQVKNKVLEVYQDLMRMQV